MDDLRPGIKVGTHKGLVTSPCNKSQEQVRSYELATFASKSSCRDQCLVPATSHTNSNPFQFLRQVTATCFSKRFVELFVLLPVPSCKLFRGLVTTSRRDWFLRVCHPYSNVFRRHKGSPYICSSLV